MIDVREYLERKGRVKNATGGNVHLACPFCNEDESKRGRLYVQTEGENAGLFCCFRCDEKGGINRLREAYGDPPLHDDDSGEADWRAAKDRQKALSAAADYYSKVLFETPAVLEHLKHERGLTEETIRDARLGFANGTLKTAMLEQGVDMDALRACGLVYPDGREFFMGYITIPYITGGHVSLIRGRAFEHDGPKYKTPLGQSPALYGSDLTFTTEGEITITEGEWDSLVLTQMGIPAVACPGVTAWEPKWADYFKDFRRIFVMFDPDQPGKTGAEKVADALSPRARIVELPPPDGAGTKFDPTELYVRHGWDRERFNTLLSKAKGGLLKSAQDAYDEWLHMQTVSGLQTGFDHMDTILFPGLLGGQVFILGAASGSGKTVFLINLMHRLTALNQDAKVLFISLEQTEHEWFERARRIYRFYNPKKSNLDALRYWRDRIWIVDENGVSAQKMREVIEQFALEVGQVPDLLVVDYLGYWARGFKGEAYERTSAAVMALKAIAKEFRVPVIAPHQLSRTSNPGEEPNASSLRESGVVLETADFAAFMWSPDQRHGRDTDDLTGERLIRLSKSRHGGVGQLFKFRLAPISLVLIPEHESGVELAKHEIAYSLMGDDFETALWRHQTGITGPSIDKYRTYDGRLMTPAELAEIEDF